MTKNRILKATMQFGKVRKHFEISTNMNEEDFKIAMVSWGFRTSDYSEEDFCDYVNSKHSGDICKPVNKKNKL